MKSRTTMGQICPTVFLVIFYLLPGIGEKLNIKVWFREFSTPGDIYFVCEKIVKTIFQRIVVSQLRRDCSRMYDNFMDPGSES